MSYSINMHGNTVTDVLSNLRKYLSNGELFCDHLLKDIPQALAQLDNQITEIERQIQEIRKQTKRRTAELIDLKKFHAVRQFQESQAQKLEPLNGQIAKINKVKKEINDGLKADKARKQKQAKQEQAQKLEKKRGHYAEEVGIFNGYKTPHELTDAIQTLHKYCRGRTLEDAVQTLILLPQRHEKLVQLRKELESENATDGLFDLPVFSTEIRDMAKYAESRTQSILGYNPRTHKLIFNEWNDCASLQKIEKNRRGGGGAALQRNLELQAVQNEKARKELVKEGLI